MSEMVTCTVEVTVRVADADEERVVGWEEEGELEDEDDDVVLELCETLGEMTEDTGEETMEELKLVPI